jgi:hypothetical protein
MHRLASSVAVTAALLAISGCSTGDAEGGGGEAEPGKPLPRVAFRLFAPVLDGAGPRTTDVWPDRVDTAYDHGVGLVQVADPGGDLCDSLTAFRMVDDTCRVEDGVAVTSMEEMSGVGLVREGTLLYWRSLVTEVDADLVRRAEAALREAPRVGLADLGEVELGEPTTPPPSPEQTAGPQPASEGPVSADDLDRGTAVRTVRHLAGTIGPREATGRAYARAAGFVARSFARLGYDVARQRVDVPAGVSWGVPVPAGRSTNVIATPPSFDPAEPHLVVGAHLDTVPQAPGAEDNASGIGVLLAVAEAASVRSTRLPVVFVAFAAEEPRGPGDADHHYGSRRYVAALGTAERAAVHGMVSLDRVGVGARVPVGSAAGTDAVQRALLAAGRRAGVPVVAEGGQRSSDHWSFVRAGLPGARLGSTPYDGYHSAGDVPAVVSPAQLERVGRLVLEWLAPRRP